MISERISERVRRPDSERDLGHLNQNFSDGK